MYSSKILGIILYGRQKIYSEIVTSSFIPLFFFLNCPGIQLKHNKLDLCDIIYML